jgi:acyl carrier protein
MTDSRQDLMERVRSVLKDMFVNDSLVITEDTDLAEIPEWDSMLHVTLVMALERKFNVRLNSKEASQSVAIRPILDLLEAKLTGHPRRSSEDTSWKP